MRHRASFTHRMDAPDIHNGHGDVSLCPFVRLLDGVWHILTAIVLWGLGYLLSISITSKRLRGAMQLDAAISIRGTTRGALPLKMRNSQRHLMYAGEKQQWRMNEQFLNHTQFNAIERTTLFFFRRYEQACFAKSRNWQRWIHKFWRGEEDNVSLVVIYRKVLY